VPSFPELADEFLGEFFALYPLHATNAGMHDHDGRWPDMTESGRQARIAFADRWTTTLEALRGDDLEIDDAVDRDLLLAELAAIRFAEAELQEEAWSPLAWIYLIGEGLQPLIALEFASPSARLESVAGRAEGIPALLGAGRERLGSIPGRPIARLHADAALERWPGLAVLLDEALALAAEVGDVDPGIAAILPRLQTAAAAAREALAEFEGYLRDEVLPRSDGEGRLGPDLFARKMSHTLHSDLSVADLRARASREFDAVRAEMIRIAREIAPRWLGERPAPRGDGELVRAVLDAIAVEHPRPDELLDVCRTELARIEAFCREHDLIGLAEEPLELRWTPLFLRSSGGAMLNSPGPLDVGQKAFFSITPVDDGSPAEIESRLREDNDRMLRLLTIHEAVPGHYLQGVYQNRCPSILRSIFWSGVFAEGWAVYVTQVMIDAGYGADDAALLLTHWKFYLRSVTNALIDIDIHAAGMTEDEAVRLMVEGGFQEDAAARGKYERARLSSTQLSTYFVGSVEFWDLELAARRRAAAAAGSRPDEVPEPELVGGFGATPGFDRRAHLEACLSHGSPPMRLLRRLVLGEEPTPSPSA
jgi:uncharacterized protein (DUF885 family)